MGKATFATEKSKRQMDRIVDLLAEPMGVLELAAELGITASMTCQYVNHMTTQKERRIRICGWMEVGRRSRKVALYKRGSGRNAPEPKAMTEAERWAKAKADPHRHARKLASWRKGYYKRNGLTPPPPRRASPFAALGL